MNNICYAIIVGCAIFNLVMLFVNFDNLFLRRKIRKEREARVKVGQQGDNGGDAAEHGTGDQK